MIETLVQYLTAATLDHGNHDVNPWFSTLLQQPSIKEIMIVSIMISLIKGCCSNVLNHGCLS